MTADDSYLVTSASEDLFTSELPSDELVTLSSNDLVSYQTTDNRQSSTAINHNNMDQIIQSTSTQW